MILWISRADVPELLGCLWSLFRESVPIKLYFLDHIPWASLIQVCQDISFLSTYDFIIILSLGKQSKSLELLDNIFNCILTGILMINIACQFRNERIGHIIQEIVIKPQFFKPHFPFLEIWGQFLQFCFEILLNCFLDNYHFINNSLILWNIFAIERY